MILNFIFFIIYIFLVFISVLGYGFLSNKLFKIQLITDNGYYSFGEVGLFSLITILPLSVLLNFFIEINYYISFLIIFVGIILFINNINLIKYKKKISILFLSLFLLIPYFILSTHHDDFFYYHLPYLNILQSSKIIFGLSNLNTVLTYPQNLWLNVISLFRTPIVEYNNMQVFNGIFTFFFLIYCFESLINIEIKKIKLLYFLNIIYVLTLFSRLKDHGTEIVPQLFMMMVFIYSFIVLFNEKNNLKIYLLKISFLFIISVLIRLSSIILLPLILFIIFTNLKEVYSLIRKFRFLLITIFLVLLVLSKNLINSGCIVYPLSFSCFNQSQISWSIDQDIPKINQDVILSYTRGWMIYAKENTPNSSKFIFNPNENILSHSEYLSKGIHFWIKYWIKDADILRILNIFLISFFTLLVILILNIKKINFKNRENYRVKLSYLFLLTLPIFFWLFLATPSTRYGGYAVFIGFVSSLIIFIVDILLDKNFKFKNTFIFMFSISLLFFFYKNISRIEFSKNISPWPKDELMIKDIDFKEYNQNGIVINLRLATDKYLMGKIVEENNYILHCGNIKPLCTPVKKIKCIKNIDNFYGYKVIKGNYDECLKLHSSHALY